MDKYKTLEMSEIFLAPQTLNPGMRDDAVTAIYGCQEQESFPQLCLQKTLSLVSACAGSFFLWDESQKAFILKSVSGPYRERVHKAHVKLREGILGWVGVQGSSVLVKDIQADHRFQSLPRMGHYRSYSFISVPLVMNHKLIGVINVTERADLQPFSETDLQLVQSLVSHMAIAYERLKYQTNLQLENSRLHEIAAILKEEKKENESFVQLGRLSANLAHELNNPMDAIRRYVNLAMDKAHEDSMTREYLGKAKKSIRRAIRIIRNLLELAAASKAPARLIEVHELIEQSLEILEDPSFEKIQVQKNFCQVPSYMLDRGFSMVLYNLYQNARHAMRGSGTLTLTTHRSEHSITIFVEDTGCGVAPTVHKRLFENLFSTKIQGEGTGLGLALCREIVERCGGSIRCDENARSGARFAITLPCQDKKGEN
jgi:signal transduction histidine kinase